MCGDSPPPAYKGPGRRAQQPGVDLAARALPRAVRRGSRGHAARREHAVLPLQPRRPAPDRGRRARREADRGAARPGRPRLLQLDAPVDGRARAARRHRRGGHAASTSASTTGWAPFWHYQGLGMYGRQVADLSTTSRASRCCCCATASSSTSPTSTLDRVFDFLGVERPGGRHDPVGQLAAVRARRRRGRGRVGAGDPGRRRRRAVPAARGVAHGQQAADQPAAQGRRPGAAEAHAGAARALLAPHLADIELLEQVTGESFEEWKGYRDGGSFESRRASSGRSARG